MRSPLQILLGLTALAVAIPLIPFFALGTRLDHAIATWLDPPPRPAVLAAAEVGILAVDILLPVPSSLVATLGGAQLGIAVGTVCAGLGMTLGAIAGWGLGRIVGRTAVARLDADARASLAAHGKHESRRAVEDGFHGVLGPVLVVITRPLPLIAEAAAIMAGAAVMPFRSFLAAAISGNLVIAFAWSVAGALGREGDHLQWMLIWSLIVPVTLTWLWIRMRVQSPPQEMRG
jgi:membrane protein DedA with SNARE-associated domain